MSEQLDIETWEPKGGTYVPELDRARLSKQQLAVFNCVSDGQWWTLREISNETGAPEASVSARLRDLRNEFELTVERRRRGDPKRGLHEYRVIGASRGVGE